MDLGWGGRMCAHDCVGVQSRHCHRRTLQVYTSWKEQVAKPNCVSSLTARCSETEWWFDLSEETNYSCSRGCHLYATLTSRLTRLNHTHHHMYSAKNSFFFLFFFFHYQFKVAPAICVTVSKYLEHEKNSAAQLLHQPTIRLLCYL